MLLCEDARYEHYPIDAFEKHNLLLEYSFDDCSLLHEICRVASRVKVVQRVVEIWIENNYGLEIVDYGETQYYITYMYIIVIMKYLNMC